MLRTNQIYIIYQKEMWVDTIAVLKLLQEKNKKIEELEEENKKLKEELSKYKHYYDRDKEELMESCYWLARENDRLKSDLMEDMKEITKLEKELN